MTYTEQEIEDAKQALGVELKAEQAVSDLSDEEFSKLSEKEKQKAQGYEVYSLSELHDMKFDPLQYVVPDLIPEGLSMVSGSRTFRGFPSKGTKTFLSK